MYVKMNSPLICVTSYSEEMRSYSVRDRQTDRPREREWGGDREERRGKKEVTQ